MLGRAGYDGLKGLARLMVRLWPLWLFYWSWRAGDVLWRDSVLTPIADRTTARYTLLYRAWPTAALAGPILTMLAACMLHRAQLASRALALASMAGLALALVLALRAEWHVLSPYVGRASLTQMLDASLGHLYALAVAVLAFGLARVLLWGKPVGRAARGGVRRAKSDNYGHADWLSIAEARRLFPGPDPDHGGIVVGEATRVDQDRVAKRRFDPADRSTWGAGGTAPLLVDPSRHGSTHALALAGSGGFKTSSIAVPTMLTWTTSAVVLDPSREVGPMVARFRARDLGHRVAMLDPSDPASDGFDALDWIDPASPLADTNIEAVATWLSGEPGRGAPPGTHFFQDMGRQLIACILDDLIGDAGSPDRTLRELRRRLVTPEQEMRGLLDRIHGSSASALARDYAGTLKGLVEETFSGVYANATQATRWLSNDAYARLVSGSTFRTADLAAGRLTVFIQAPLKALDATPGLGRVIVGSLLNAAYEADGAVTGRILFLLDEVARLGPMRVIETARDAGRKYGLTLLLLYQSAGQLVEQWGKDGARAWYDSVSWRLYAALSDPETARELSRLCGEHGVMASSHGDSAGTQSGGAMPGGRSTSGRSENRSEMARPLIKPDELLHDVRDDEAFVIHRGARPLRCGRAIWFRRPDMVAHVEHSRFHP